MVGVVLWVIFVFSFGALAACTQKANHTLVLSGTAGRADAVLFFCRDRWMPQFLRPPLDPSKPAENI